jgi:acyl-CoA thioesterase-1
MPDIYLFTGDSITDAGRTRDTARSLGDGYVRRLAEVFTERQVDANMINTGVSGDRVTDLSARWATDVVAHRPTLLSVLVGANDTWRRYDSDDPTSAESFSHDYRLVLEAVDRSVTKTVVLVEPFLVPVHEEQGKWREDLDPKIEVVRKLAREFDAVLVPADVELNRRATELGPEAIAGDGVHPTEFGHRVLAELWYDTVRP